VSTGRSRRLERLAWRREKRRREETDILRRQTREREAQELNPLQPALRTVWPGYDFVRTGNDPPARVMQRALEAMGLPAIMRGGLASTPAGIDAAHALRAAHQLYSSSYLGLARRFKRRPEVFAEFSAAWRLDASADTLKSILVQLWKEKKTP
jgi:hypothetical protein